MNLFFYEKLPSPEEYNFLRKSVGWGTYNISVIENSIKNSLFSICVYDSDAIIGMGRVVGDGGMIFYIQDVIVLEDYQGKGIGSKIMSKIVQYINSNSHNNTMIGLLSSKGKEGFYKSFGFVERPSGNMGAGMIMYVKKD